MAEVVQLLRAGKKIEAIKIYREIFGVGLKEAKDAVEAIEAGLGSGLDSSVGRTVSTVQVGRAAKSIGCVSTGVGLLVAIGIVGFVLAMVFGLPFRLSGSYRQALDAARFASCRHRIPRRAGPSQLVAHPRRIIVRQLVQRQL